MFDLNIPIQNSRFFDGMTEKEARQFLTCMHAKVIRADTGEMLIRAAMSPATTLLVLSGKVMVYEEDYWGNRNIVGTFVDGDILGDPVIQGQEHLLNVSAEAIEPSIILKFDLYELMDICDAHCPGHYQFMKNFLRYLSLRVTFLKTKISHLSRRSTRSKLLWYLYTESVRQGSNDFTIPYNRQQLADYLCVDRAAMSAELSKLQEEGLLTTHRSHFTLSPAVSNAVN